MGFFGKKKNKVPANEQVAPEGAQTEAISATTGGITVPQGAVEDAVQYRVPPGVSMYPPGENYSGQRAGIDMNQPRNDHYPDSHRPSTYYTPRYERSALPTPRDRSSYCDAQATFRSNSHSPRPKHYGHDDCRSDDDSCYRSSSYCNRCCKPSNCDCYADSRQSNSNMKTTGTTEVFETVYTCYDPNCKGDSSCKHWKIEEATRLRQASTTSGQQYQGPTNEIITTTTMTKQQMQMPPVPKPVVTTTTYQTTTYPSQPIYGQAPMFAGAPVMMSPHPQVMMGQHTQPYIVNRRQVPMMVGGVPVVIPAGHSGAQIVGAVRTTPAYPAITTQAYPAITTQAYPAITTRPLQF